MNKNKKENKKEKENFWNEGIIMILLSAFTDALIYFLIKNIKTENNWNILFISYSMGTFLLSIYYLLNKKKNIILLLSKNNDSLKNTFYLSLIINAFIGLSGFLLRFYSVKRLNTKMYALLSYFGIVTAYFYGVIFNKDAITFQKIIGTIFILLPNFIEKYE